MTTFKSGSVTIMASMPQVSDPLLIGDLASEACLCAGAASALVDLIHDLSHHEFGHDSSSTAELIESAIEDDVLTLANLACAARGKATLAPHPTPILIAICQKSFQFK